MKKRQKRLLGLLLACAVACAPVSQAFAETSYDVSVGVDAQVLFPNDSLTGITGGVTLNGEAVTLEDGSTWKNSSDEGKVRRAELLEDGTIEVKDIGYVVLVEGGTVKLSEGDDSYHHYSYGDWEKPEKKTDRAWYQEGDKVKLTADTPAEGMEFAGWDCSTEGVSIADPSSSETSFEMVGRKVKITALFREAVQTPETPEPAEEQQPDVPVEMEPTEEQQPDASVETEPTEGQQPDVSVETEPTEGQQPDVSVEPEPTEEQQPDTASGETAVDVEPESPAIYTVTLYDATLVKEDEAVGEEGAISAQAEMGQTETGQFEAGAQVTVQAADRSDGGWVFNGWFVDSLNVTLDSLVEEKTSFIMPEGEVVLSATYVKDEEAPSATTPSDSLIVPETPDNSEQTNAPETTAPSTPAPETPAPETPAPETPAPETPAPETPAPETPAPETPAPETPAPETPAPTEPESFEVTVENGNGSGTYATGQVVPIEAPAELDDQVFAGWKASSEAVTFADPTQAATSFVMPGEAVTLTPTYVPATYSVTVVNGTADQQVAEAGVNVTVTASDRTAEGLVFDHWEGIAVVKGQETAITFADASAQQTTFPMMQGEVNVQAVYTEMMETYQVKVANGLINGSSTELTCEEGTIITVQANPSPSGQKFSYWLINDGVNDDLGDAIYNETIELTVTENLELKAVYEGIQYNIKVEDGYSNYDACVSGTEVTITADEAPEGWEFDYWSVDTQNASLADAYDEETTFVMPAADVKLSAHYRQIEYALEVENGKGDKEYYHAGDEVTISSNYPASGRVFNQWEAVSGNVTFADGSRWKTTFKMPATDVSVRATYKDGPSINDNVILDLVAGGEYYTGDTIKFTASGAGMSNSNPNPGDYRYRPTGYQIGNVTGTLQSPYSISMSIKAVGDYTLKVTYTKDVYDGNNWVSDGTTDSKSVTFRVVTKTGAVATGDETPITIVVAIAVVSCVIFLLLLILFLKKRKK